MLKLSTALAATPQRTVTFNIIVNSQSIYIYIYIAYRLYRYALIVDSIIGGYSTGDGSHTLDSPYRNMSLEHSTKGMSLYIIHVSEWKCIM